jgi:(S)-2-hydroxyglutarate dehydrogenase
MTARSLDYDFAIIGGGIVGLASALAILARAPAARIIVFEKEAALATHQTGHNSGVIHAGVYYAPGSLKARLAKAGCAETKAFCREHHIHVEECGKLLVATDETELGRAAALFERAKENGLAVEWLGRDELARLEPNVRGLGAILVPETGIVDYRRVAERMAAVVRAAGDAIALGVAITGIEEDDGGVSLRAGDKSWRVGRLIACAGLQSDRIARLAGLAITHRIVPFRGEYYDLPQARARLVRHLIYPIPDPDLPFLGIHLTRTIEGGIMLGPNAVLGRAREGYGKAAFDGRDVADYFAFPGFWRFAAGHWRSGLDEFRNSLSRRRYLALCRKYCPSLELADLQPRPAGIRAQAMMADGTLVHDFLFVESARMLHVCNAPSPAATSAIPIGRMIADRVLG